MLILNLQEGSESNISQTLTKKIFLRAIYTIPKKHAKKILKADLNKDSLFPQ